MSLVTGSATIAFTCPAIFVGPMDSHVPPGATAIIRSSAVLPPAESTARYVPSLTVTNVGVSVLRPCNCDVTFTGAEPRTRKKSDQEKGSGVDVSVQLAFVVT